MPWPMLTALAVLASMAVLIAGCGSSGSSSTGASASGTKSPSGAVANISAAKALVAQYEKTQPPLAIPKVSKRPPQGLTVAYVNCTIPTCSPGEATPAIKALGWKQITANWDITQGPSAVSTAFTTALQQKPKAILFRGVFPDSVFAKQFAAAKAAGIPVAQTGSGEYPDAKYGFAICSLCEQNLLFSGKLQGAIALANAGKATSVGYAVDPTISGAVDLEHGAEAYLKQNGGGSKFYPIDISSSASAATNAATEVAALQKNPDIKYIMSSFSEATSGLPQLLKQNGLSSQVQIIQALPEASDEGFIRQGEELAAVDCESGAADYRALDALVRLSVGDKIPTKFPSGWHQIVTKANVGAVSQPANYAQLYEKAWGVG
jgi:hypothetical protein